MNLLTFLVSIIASSIGVILDNLTTKKFISEVGIEMEGNANFIKIVEKWGYKTWVVIEVLAVVAFGIFDSTLNILFVGIFFGLYRGLMAASNFQGISDYRTIGKDVFREEVKRYRKLYQNVSRIERYKMNMVSFMCFSICIVASCLVFAITSLNWLFLTFPIDGLIYGIGLFFLNSAIFD